MPLCSGLSVWAATTHRFPIGVNPIAAQVRCISTIGTSSIDDEGRTRRSVYVWGWDMSHRGLGPSSKWAHSTLLLKIVSTTVEGETSSSHEDIRELGKADKV